LDGKGVRYMRRPTFLGFSADQWREIYDAENPLTQLCRTVFAEEKITSEEAESHTAAEAGGGSRWIGKMFEPFG